MCGQSEYYAWDNMKRRCLKENHKDYPGYGKRGITVCDRWRYSFVNFYEDMGNKPFIEAQIDRIDNNGDYEPCNCRWTSAATNTRNRAETILNVKYVVKIRELYKTGLFTYETLSLVYSVSNATIAGIIKNRTWILKQIDI